MNNIIKRLEVLLALLAVIPLAWAYQQINPSTNNKFILLIFNVIPSLIAVLVGIPVLYFLLNIIGLEKLFNKKSTNNKLSIIEQEVRLIRSYTEERISQLELVKNFQEEFYDCDWGELINSSNSHIDIVVYYFDSWINRNRKSLAEFFSKKNTTMNIVVTDPEIENNLNEISRLYPDSEKDVLKTKIIKTSTRLESIANEAGVDTSRIKFYYYPHLLNYSFQIFDNSIIAISIFEMFRKDHLKSPTFILNLEKSAKLKQFFQKELNGLISNSRKL